MKPKPKPKPKPLHDPHEVPAQVAVILRLDRQGVGPSLYPTVTPRHTAATSAVTTHAAGPRAAATGLSTMKLKL